MDKCQVCGKFSSYLVGNKNLGMWLCEGCDDDEYNGMLDHLKNNKKNKKT